MKNPKRKPKRRPSPTEILKRKIVAMDEEILHLKKELDREVQRTRFLMTRNSQLEEEQRFIRQVVNQSCPSKE